jgi:acetoacetate decarboxylase
MSRTRYVRTSQEIDQLQAAFRAPAFLDIRSLAIVFESEAEAIAELLPPPLETAAEPRVSVSVSQIRRSNCVGPFDGASVNIACRYRGGDGVYCLAMPMSTDTAVTFGRELYAEPKKLAQIALEERPNGNVLGTVTRHGITFIELVGRFEDPMRDVDSERTTKHYYFKFLPSADGTGLAHDPELVCVTHRGHTRSLARGTGTITFRESSHDPIIDVPVISVLGATYSIGDTHTSAEVVATVPAADFLPYAFGKMDDLRIWAAAGALSPA